MDNTPYLPEEPLGRFEAIYAALNAERGWWSDAASLRFAAMAAVTCPGEPGDVARASRHVADAISERAGETLTVRIPTLDAPADSLRLALCDRDGQPFDTRRLQPKAPATFELDKYPGDSPEPACLKLLDAGRLVDIAAIPTP